MEESPLQSPLDSSFELSAYTSAASSPFATPAREAMSALRRTAEKARAAGAPFPDAAVRRVEADYLAPARLDDRLDVLTWVAERKPARMIMGQEVRRGDKVLFRALVTVICMTLDGRPVRMPVWDES